MTRTRQGRGRALTRTALAVALATVVAACGSVGTPQQPTQQTLPPPAAVAPLAPAAAAPSSPAAPAGGGRCTTDRLDARFVVRPDELGAHRVAVIWTNRSGSSCTMYGFGGVDLDGPDQQPYGPTYHLPRAERDPATVTLGPSESAETVINYLSPDDARAGWLPSRARVTPPDETRSITLPWSFGGVTRQDGATHPGTFLQPVAPVPSTDPPACTAQDLRADLVAGDAAAGNRYTSLRLSSRDGHRCTLAGPLPIVLQDAGRVIVTRDPGDQGATAVVDGSHAASVRLHWTVASEPQVTPGAVTVRLPGTSEALTVPWSGGPVDAAENHFSISAGPLATA